MNRLLLFIFLISTLTISAQEQWYTDYEIGLNMAKEKNKKILLEVGSVIDGIPLFIDDGVWESDVVKDELTNYIPISIEITTGSPLIKKFKLQFSPTLLILDNDEHVLFKDSGRKDEMEVKNILSTVHNNYSKTTKLVTLYPEGEFSEIGTSLKLEQYLNMSLTGPESMNRYFLKSARKELELLQANKESLNDQLKQRLKIFEIAYEMIAYYDLSNQRKLYKIGKKDLKSRNHSLLLFYLILGEEYGDDREKALNIYEELKKRREKDKQAVEYCYNLQKLYDYE